MTKKITNSQNLIDSRDILIQIKELEKQLGELLEDYPEEQDSIDKIQKELDLMYSIQNKWGNVESFRLGVMFIRDNYFENYARGLVKDIYCFNGEEDQWPYNHIDWGAATEELKKDYLQIDFDGVTYYGLE